MKSEDLKNRISEIIKEEIKTVLAEYTYKYGGLLDPKDFDPIDPEVHVYGFATLLRSSLRKKIVEKLQGAVATAKQAQTGGPMSYEKYKSLDYLLDPKKGMIPLLIKAEIEVAEQLEAMRKKGGRRAQPIPKQF